MVGIIDFNAGNITSLERALEYLKIDFIRSKNPDDLKECDRFIFPGDGDDAYAMDQLKKSGFDVFVREQVKNRKPLLGICVGSQIIFEKSEEGNAECLGLIKGEIKHFYSIDPQMEQKKIKVPHMGWNNITFENGDCPILEGIKNDSDVYFVHSFVIQPEDFSVVKAYAEYKIKVPAVIQKENVFACQFHPEKSGTTGLKILENFCKC
ncbi:MAG: imidazole glycerol phosphate synthase subunit HisH [Treponema sp.]|uniref:imidazole glycerol phosphate synthase subunit HisH n=1 Tax=Treponema sp. TaxID=166 RepID=UPI00298E2391|nr:imidazole glycerol phosphate synthase subunit HisH [Treponema sp.]MCR5386035.1 imidazole glycerol phosphate synthase subunit HisH [Treponema sp.]